MQGFLIPQGASSTSKWFYPNYLFRSLILSRKLASSLHERQIFAPAKAALPPSVAVVFTACSEIQRVIPCALWHVMSVVTYV